MSPAKKTTRSGSKSSAKRSTAKKKTAAKKTTKKKATATRSTSKKKTSAKKKPAATRSTSKKKTAARSKGKKTAAKKTTKKKTTAKKTTGRSAGTATGAKKTVEAAPATKPTTKRQKPVFKTPIRKLPVQKKKTPRPAKLDAETLRNIRAQLEEERNDLRRQQEELEEDSFEGTQSELTGEVGLDEDFADAGTATFDRERDLSIRNNIRDLIEQIERAMRRIDEGSYGTCERCGQPIDAARVKALPHASLCLDCKRREERVR